ncbi:serpin family protein [Paenibacillus sp. JCM 10914]|uniref:serpin family protein n=1 Tax=Paenibacillus sp. JCM 10914 TaxID=1236974 RepID=UPI0003CC451B|nr:serpin family protein [Paenibacillus sp. JCM 10914]GAE05609.1 serine protease inhibitor [Paenibacillus sp. JCM 10914]
MKKWSLIIGVCLLMGLTACGQGEGEVQPADSKGIEHRGNSKPKSVVKELTDKERQQVLSKVNSGMVQAQNSFGLRLHEALHQELEEDNLIISPYSITQALALAYNGAAGDTASEMAAVLGWEEQDIASVNDGNQQLKLLLERGSGVVLNAANSVWYNRGIQMKPAYLDVMKNHYAAAAQATDMESEEAKDAINKWVENNTGGMIPMIYDKPPGGVAALINAIYFNGGWSNEFNAADTTDQDFTLMDGRKKNVRMMKQERKYDYKEGESWQAVRIPYGDGRMHMLVILPKESSSLNELHQQLWQDTSLWKDDFGYETVQLELPKFKVEQTFELPDALKSLGMVKAFSETEADFSDMANDGDEFYVNYIKHKTVVDVSEKGTEAAAVTAVGVDTTSMPLEPIQMQINRPFFFAIEDRDTGTWLFMGSVMNP